MNKKQDKSKLKSKDTTEINIENNFNVSLSKNFFSKENSELKTHTMIIGKTSDGMKN